MRTWLMSFALLSGLLCGGLAGCSGEGSKESNNNTGTEGKDGSVDGGEQNADAEATEDADQPNADGEVVALDGDLPGEDAALDAGTEPGVPTFSITVRRGATPMPEVRVWFHDAAGALTGDFITNSAGRVESVTAPAMVTVLPVTSGAQTSGLLFTYTAVAANDQLVLELPVDPSSGELVAAYNLSVMASEIPLSYLQAYAGANGCASLDFSPGQSPVTLSWPGTCPVAAANSILAVGYLGTYDVGGFAFAKGAPAFGATPVAVPLGPWTAPGAVQLTANNLPLNSYAIASLGLWSEGARFGLYDWQLELSAGSTSRNASFATPVGFADGLDVLLNTSGPATSQHSTVVVRQAPAAQLTVDYATRVAGATGGTHGGSAARPSFSWQLEPASSTPADATVLALSWRIQLGETVGSQSWFLLGPGDVTSMTAPELPALIAGLLPSETPVANVSHFASGQFDGYRAFVAQPVRPTPSDDRSAHPLAVELPVAGYLHAVTWTEEAP